MTNYITRAESINAALDAHADSGDLEAAAMEMMSQVGRLDATDVIEAAQVLLDAKGSTFVGAARVFGALFGVRDENDARGIAEVLIEWDRSR